MLMGKDGHSNVVHGDSLKKPFRELPRGFAVLCPVKGLPTHVKNPKRAPRGVDPGSAVSIRVATNRTSGPVQGLGEDVCATYPER